MPAAARHSVSALVGLNAVMGFFGAFTFPMQKVLLRDWAPLSLGTERVWALRAGAYGMQAGIVATTFLTPLLAAKFGWRLVPRLYGTALVIGGAIWQLVAVNTPAGWKGISEEELALLTQHKAKKDDGDAGEEHEEQKTSEASDASSTQAQAVAPPLPPRLLVHPSVLATFWINVADNAAMYTLQQWAAVWFTERALPLHPHPPPIPQRFNGGSPPLPTDHGVSATRAGGFLAAANAVNVAGQFISAAVEDLLQRKGYSLLTIRRIGAGGGSFTQAVCVTLFGLAPSPLLASVIFSAHNLAESFTSNGCELSATVCPIRRQSGWRQSGWRQSV